MSKELVWFRVKGLKDFLGFGVRGLRDFRL